MREPADLPRETPANAAGASPTAFSLARTTIVCLAAGVFLGIIGPLDTSALPIGLRLGYWIVAAVGGGLIGWAATRLVLRWPRARANPALMALVVALGMTPPAVLFIRIWSGLAVPTPPVEWLPLTGAVFVISLAITAVNVLVQRPAAAPQTPVALAPPPPPPTAALFLDRLPPRLRGARILAVEAQDHYLRVHTDRGSDLILLRLSDALGELALLDGARTHRSWWVAREAVRGVTRSDGRATLTLDGGVKAPVSRAHAPALRAAGWF